MICKKCGKNIRDDLLFCEYCGTKVEKEEDAGKKADDNSGGKFCGYCGTYLSNDMEFCYKCGKPVNVSKSKNTMNAQKAYTDFSTAIKDNSFIKSWGFKLCGVVALIGLFLPLIDYGFYSESAFGLFSMLMQGGGDDTTGVTVLFALGAMAYVGLSIAVILDNRVSDIKIISSIGTGLLLCVRILPNLIMRAEMNGEFGFGLDLIQYGYGWWIMFLAFGVATVFFVVDG